MFHVMHVSYLLCLAHLAHGIRCPKIIDPDTAPSTMGYARLTPLSSQYLTPCPLAHGHLRFFISLRVELVKPRQVSPGRLW